MSVIQFIVPKESTVIDAVEASHSATGDGTISIWVWHDGNDDGLINSGQEATDGYENVQIYAETTGGSPLASVYTDSSGFGVFAGFTPDSDYRLRIVSPADAAISTVQGADGYSLRDNWFDSATKIVYITLPSSGPLYVQCGITN